MTPVDYTQAARLSPLQLLPKTKAVLHFWFAGNLRIYNTGGYSIQNTRTGLGDIIWSAVYNSTANKTLITCDYSRAWASSKVKFNVGDPFRICRVLRVLDQMGLGKGTLCSTPKSLNGAVNEASYAWNNTQANGSKVTPLVPEHLLIQRL